MAGVQQKDRIMTIVRSATPVDLPAIDAVLARAFRMEGVIERQIVHVISQEDPRFCFDHLRVAEVDGQVASLALLIPRRVHVGTVVVDGVQVAPVATHPDYERRGLCSAVMRDAVGWMKANGYDLTLLWGNPWLYPHYGYSAAMPWVSVTVQLRQAPPPPEGWRFTPLAPEHLVAIQAIYHDNTRTRTCAELRTAGWWEWRPRVEQATSFVALDPAGAVGGYCLLTVQADHLEVFDAGVRDPAAADAILAHLAKLGQEHELTQATCNLPPDHPFSRAAFWRDAEVRLTRGHAAGMIRVLNLPRLLARMRDEFERRIARTEFACADRTLRIAGDEGAALIRLRHGQVTVEADGPSPDQVFLPLAQLNPLVTGFRDIEELLAEPGVEVSGEAAVRLVQALFPTGYAHWPLAAFYHE
jgi:predicted N-acetyltransferase YhbS